MSAKIIVVGNEKGGVGKTTCSVQLGFELANRGFKVLIIDNDSSGDAVTALCGDEVPDEILLVDKPEGVSNTYKMYMEDQSFSPYPIEENLHLMGATESLSMLNGTNLEPMYMFGLSVEKLTPHYDYILIDCPPSFGIAFSAAIFAGASGGGLLIPVLTDELSFKAAKKTIERVEQQIRVTKIDFSILGVVANRVENNPMPQATRYYIDEMQQTFGDRFFSTMINKAVAISNATALRQKVSDVAKSNAKAVIQLKALVDELIERLAVKQ